MTNKLHTYILFIFCYFYFSINLCANTLSLIKKDVRHVEDLPKEIIEKLEGKSVVQQSIYLLEELEDLQFSDNELAIRYASHSLKLARLIEEEYLEAKSLYWHVSLNLEKHVYTNYLAVLLNEAFIAATIFEKKGDSEWLVRTLELLAATAYFQSKDKGKDIQTQKIDLANQYLKEGFYNNQYVQNNNVQQELRAILLTTKAVVNFSKNDIYKDSAMIWWTEAEKLFENNNNTLGIARVNLNRGLFALDTNNINYFEKSINAYSELGDKAAQKRAMLRLGSYYVKVFRINNDPKIWALGLQTIQEGLQIRPNENMCDGINRIAEAYFYRFKEGETRFLNTTSDYFMEALALSKEEMNLNCLEDYKDLKIATCKDLQKCDDYLKAYGEAYQLILNNQDSVVAQAVQQKADYVQLVQSNQSKKRQQLLIGIALAILTSIGALFYTLFQRQRLQKLKVENEAQAAKIQALGARMNPHFISNTLNAIDSLIITNKKEEASKYLIDFSRLSRLILANSADSLIPLEKEMEMLKYYLRLEKMRFEEQLEYDLNVESSINIENTFIPVMLVQPFVENAILHGIQTKKSTGKVNIQFNDKGANQLQCIIEDNGIGRKAAKAKQAASKNNRKSYSMAIAKDRIDLINKIEGATLEIVDLYDASNKATGTRIIITLPKNLKTNE